MSANKKLLWVEDSLITKLQLLDEVEQISNEDVKSFIKQFNESIDLLSENIDSNVLDIRAKAQRVRDTYKKAVETEIEETDLLWENLDLTRSKIRKKVSESIVEVENLKDKVALLNKAIENISLYDYRLEKTLDLVNRIAEMSEKEKELLTKLIEVSK